MVINFQIWVCKENVRLFIYMVLFYNYKFLNIGIQGNVCLFIHIVLFYNYKFSNMGIQGN